MSRFLFALFLAGCGNLSLASQEAGKCPDEGCVPAKRVYAVEIQPTETDLIACETRAEDLEITDQGWRVYVQEPVLAHFVVASKDVGPIEASLLVSRPSLIAGRPPVVQAADTDSNGEAWIPIFPLDRTLGTYEVRVTPVEKDIWPPMVEREIVIEASRTVEIFAPSADELLTIEGHVVGLGVHRVRGVADDGTPTTTTTTQAKSGAFVLRAPPTFSGPFTLVVEPIEGVTEPTFYFRQESLEGGRELALPPLPEMRDFCVNVGGFDKANIPAVAASAEIVFQTRFDALIKTYADEYGSGVDQAILRVRATTDATGLATLPLLLGDADQSREYDVGIQPSPGDQFAVWSDQVEVPSDPAPSKCPFLSLPPLERRASLGGVVSVQTTTGEGMPVEGATVEATPATAPDWPDFVPQPSANAMEPTDSAGGFHLRVENGRYNLEVQPAPLSGLPIWWRDNVLVEGETTVELLLPEFVVSQIEVVRMDGRPVPGASVRLYEPATKETQSRLRGEGTTEESGSAFITLANP